MKPSVLSVVFILAMAVCVAGKGNPIWTHTNSPITATPATTAGPATVIIGNYTFAFSHWTQCSATCSGADGVFRTRQVRCIRRGSYNLPLPESFCTKYGATKPAMTERCNIAPCSAPAAQPGAPVPAPTPSCQNNAVADGVRIFKANITIYSADVMAKSTVLYPTKFKMQVDQAVRAGPIVLTWVFTSKSGKVLYSGEKVGQAQSDNSFLIASFEDLADPCDTVSKGRGVFAVTMNQMTTSNVLVPNTLSVDPEYYSRQKLTWYWPDKAPMESPDMSMVLNTPYTKEMKPKEKYIYGKNPLVKTTYHDFMLVRQVAPSR